VLINDATTSRITKLITIGLIATLRITILSISLDRHYDCRIYAVILSIDVPNFNKVNVIRLSVVMLNSVTLCQYSLIMLIVIMLIVFMLTVITLCVGVLSVIMLSV
jgi:hypothetical protein